MGELRVDDDDRAKDSEPWPPATSGPGGILDCRLPRGHATIVAERPRFVPACPRRRPAPDIAGRTQDFKFASMILTRRICIPRRRRARQTVRAGRRWLGFGWRKEALLRGCQWSMSSTPLAGVADAAAAARVTGLREHRILS